MSVLNAATSATKKVEGCFVGCAVGDALGMPVEGWPAARIKKHLGRITEMLDPVLLRDEAGNLLSEDEFGKIHHWTQDFSKGEYTDDTILTLAIAESIIERGYPDLYHITEKQLSIFIEHNKGRNKCGFGGTTKSAFERLQNGVSPLKSGVIGGPGTGPAMKLAPLGLWAALDPLDMGRGVTAAYLAKLLGKSTHLDPRSVVCGILQVAAIKRLFQDPPPKTQQFIKYLYDLCRAWEEPLTKDYTWYQKGNIADKIAWIGANTWVSEEEAHDYLGSSSAVYKAYPFVIWMLQKHWENPIAGLEELVNWGGDCDTTGAMYGALVGARWGNIFPEKWTTSLQNYDYIIDVANRFRAMGAS